MSMIIMDAESPLKFTNTRTGLGGLSVAGVQTDVNVVLLIGPIVL